MRSCSNCKLRNICTVYVKIIELCKEVCWIQEKLSFKDEIMDLLMKKIGRKCRFYKRAW